MAEKRARSANFSSEEKLYCLNIIKKYKHVIENKETGGTLWREKENAWKTVEREFNAGSAVFRSVEVLKRFYNNQKKYTRKEAAQQKLSLYKTGGGTAIKAPDDPVFNLTLDLVNKKTIFGLGQKFDDDARINTNDGVFSEVGYTDGKMPEENTELENEQRDEVIVLQYEDENDVNDSAEDITNIPCTSWHNYTRKDLTTPLHPSLKHVTQAKKKGQHNRSTSRPTTQIFKSDSVALHYEEVAILKKEVLQLQLNILKEEEENIKKKNEFENSERQKRQKRDAEEFDLRKTALQLDIKIKEEQLRALHEINK